MLKLNAGFSRKVGEANFSSRGASVNVELELESGLGSDGNVPVEDSADGLRGPTTALRKLCLLDPTGLKHLLQNLAGRDRIVRIEAGLLGGHQW